MSKGFRLTSLFDRFGDSVRNTWIKSQMFSPRALLRAWLTTQRVLRLNLFFLPRPTGERNQQYLQPYRGCPDLFSDSGPCVGSSQAWLLLKRIESRYSTSEYQCLPRRDGR